MRESNFPAIPDRLKRLGVKDGDWFTACKEGLAWLMRPGQPIKARISMCLILHSQGYNNELAMMQVQRQAAGDASLFVALSPRAIISILQKFAIEQFRKSGIELDDVQRKKLRTSNPNIRRELEELEQEDGTITRVRANCDPKRLIGLTFDEALANNLITPIENLSQLDRKKLAYKSFIYVHTHPRAATKTALTRRVDDDLLNPSSKEDRVLKMESCQQMAFRYLKAFGLADAKFAAKVAQGDDYQRAYAEVTSGRTAMQHGIDRLKKLMERKAKEEITRRQMNFFDEPAKSQASAVLNPNGSGESGESIAPSAARAADTHIPLKTMGASVGAESLERAPRTGAESAPFLASSNDVRIPDAEFKQEVIAAFVGAGRTHPSPGQLRDVLESLPDHALARPAFLADLRESMPRIKHPGVLSSHVRGFAAAWPAKLEKLEAARSETQKIETRQRANQRAVAIEEQLAAGAETIWESLTATDRNGRIAAILPGLQKQYGQRLPADMIAKNAEAIAKGQFIQEHIAKVSQGAAGISEVA